MGNRSGTQERNRTLFNPNGVSQYLTQMDNSFGGGQGFRGKIGADYNFSKSDVLTYSLNIGRNKRVSNNESEY